MRFAVVFLLAIVLAVPAGAATLTRYWSVAHAMRSIDGARVRVGTRVLRIHADTTVCSGKGRRIRRQGMRMWSRFVCTFTTFTKIGLDRDLEFDVQVTGRARFLIRDADWIAAIR
jgi:hypothetical protein